MKRREGSQVHSGWVIGERVQLSEVRARADPEASWVQSGGALTLDDARIHRTALSRGLWKGRSKKTAVAIQVGGRGQVLGGGSKLEKQGVRRSEGLLWREPV